VKRFGHHICFHLQGFDMTNDVIAGINTAWDRIEYKSLMMVVAFVYETLNIGSSQK
jgi:hypothetical protein